MNIGIGIHHILYYFPKGTDFNDVSEKELPDVIEKINNRWKNV